MRIAFLSTFYPFRGGIAQFNGALFRALEKQHEVKAFNFTVQYPNFLFPGKTQFVTEQDQVDEIPTKRVLHSLNPLTYRKTVKEIKKFNPDVLIIGYWMPYMAPSLGYVAKKLKKQCKVISIVHNAIPHEQGILDRILSNYFFKNNSHCIALSEAVKNDIENSYPKIKTKVFLHPVYEHFGEKLSREEALHQLSLNPNRKYLLFFGLIRDYKGLDNLLNAMALLNDNIHLMIAGEVYGSFDKYQEIIDANKLKDRVHLHLEYIPDNKVKYFFSCSNVVVLPYNSGTQSGIIAIAKHFNSPVVATDVGGLSEFIKENEGIIVPKNSLQELAKGIESVLEIDYLTDKEDDKAGNWVEFANKVIDF